MGKSLALSYLVQQGGEDTLCVCVFYRFWLKDIWCEIKHCKLKALTFGFTGWKWYTMIRVMVSLFKYLWTIGTYILANFCCTTEQKHGIPNRSVHSNIFQLLLVDPNVLPGQTRYIIPPVSSVSTPRSPHLEDHSFWPNINSRSTFKSFPELSGAVEFAHMLLIRWKKTMSYLERLFCLFPRSRMNFYSKQR